MKLSIIIGVSQMVVGIFLKAANTFHFHSAIDFFFEFIPQILFMLSTFGYMVFLIFVKWSNDYTHDTSQAPSILTTFINFGLKGGSTDGNPIYGDPGVQDQIQLLLLIIALISVPWMLLPKPFILRYLHER